MTHDAHRLRLGRSTRDGLTALGCAVACAWVIAPPLRDAVGGAPMPDFAVYWTAARLWLDGGDPTVFSALSAVAPEPVGGPFAYPAWTLLAFVPWAWLPYPLAKAAWACGIGLGLAGGTAVWASLGRRATPEAPPRWTDPLVHATRAVLATAVAWTALGHTVTMGLLPGNLAAVQAAVVPLAIALAVRAPTGVGAVAVMAPFALSRWVPLLWLPAWWPIGRRRAVTAAAILGVLGVAAAQVGLGLHDPWSGVIAKLTERMPTAVDHSLASFARTLGLSATGAAIGTLATALVLVGVLGPALRARRDAAAMVSWIAGTLLCVPRMPDYEWLLLPGIVAFTLIRTPWALTIPLVGALLLPDHGFRPLWIDAAALLALQVDRLTTARVASSSGIPASR